MKTNGSKPTVSSWKKVDAEDAILNFPQLSEEDLRSLTMGIYQLKQSYSYSVEHCDEEGLYEIYVGKAMDDILCVRIQSRHTKSKKYLLRVQYQITDSTRQIYHQHP